MKVNRPTEMLLTVLKGGIYMNSISFPVRSSYTDYGKFASGKKIQKASDGAAESAIIQKQEQQVRSYEAGKKNISVMKSLTNITDVAQSGVNDYLQRMNELVARSNSSLMSGSDKEMIQQEIDVLKDGISQIASTADFNGKKLLDGSNLGFQVADGAGKMSSITTSNSTIETIGLGDFSITGKYNSKQITDALTGISKQRTQALSDETLAETNLREAQEATPARSSSISPTKDSGAMATIETANSKLEATGLGKFSLTGKYSSKQITDALSEISRQRTQAQTDEAAQKEEEQAEMESVSSRMNILEGANPSYNAQKGSGTMATIGTSNSALETLGLGKFSLTGKYNAKQITDALSEVSRQRAKTGAQQNGLEYAFRSQSNAAYQTSAAQSRIGDLDYPQAISEQRKKEVLQEYAGFVQRTNMRIQGDKTIFFE